MQTKYKTFWAMFLLVVFTTTILAGLVMGKAAAASASSKSGEFLALYITKNKAGDLYISGYYWTNWMPCRLTIASAEQTLYKKDMTFSGKHMLLKKKVTPGKTCTLKLTSSKHGSVTVHIPVKEAKYYKGEGKLNRVYTKPR